MLKSLAALVRPGYLGVLHVIVLVFKSIMESRQCREACEVGRFDQIEVEQWVKIRPHKIKALYTICENKADLIRIKCGSFSQPQLHIRIT